jgi:DNA-binding phage protein
VDVLKGWVNQRGELLPKMRLFDERDVIHLLQSEVKRAGGQTAWARKTGTDRPMLNKILRGRLSPTKKIIDLLNLRLVYVSKKNLPHSK